MYIRRKVFSVLADEMGEERLYSVNDTLFEGYEVDELDERMYASIVGSKAGSSGKRMTEEEALKWLEKYAGKDGDLKKGARMGTVKERGVQTYRDLGSLKGTSYGDLIDGKVDNVKEVLQVNSPSKAEIKQLKEKQRASSKRFKDSLKEQKEAFLKSDKYQNLKMKKALHDSAYKAGKKSAGLKDAFKNASKLGKAGMVLVPAAALGGAVALGRASKND